METKAKPILRQSEIKMFLRCPKQWKYRYIEGIKAPPVSKMFIGSSVHAGAEHNYRQKIQSEKDLSIDEVKDATSTFFDKNKSEVDFEGADPNDSKDQAVLLVEEYHKKFSPTVQPKEVERKYAMPNNGHPWGYEGTIDIVRRDGVIADIKTAGRRGSYKRIDRDIQAIGYDILYENNTNEKSPGFQYQVVIKTKTPGTETVDGTIDREAREWFMRVVGNVFKSMEFIKLTGIITEKDENDFASPCGFCGYYNRCKGKKK